MGMTTDGCSEGAKWNIPTNEKPEGNAAPTGQDTRKEIAELDYRLHQDQYRETAGKAHEEQMDQLAPGADAGSSKVQSQKADADLNRLLRGEQSARDSIERIGLERIDSKPLPPMWRK